MSVSGRLDQNLFHVIEVQNNSAAYLDKRKNVIDVRSSLGHLVRSIGRYDIVFNIVFNMAYGCVRF